jgi:hypothetical protein
MLKSTLLVAMSALLAHPAGAQLHLEAGGGVASVSRSAGGGSDVSPTVHLGVGIRVGPRMTLLIEGDRYGMLDEEPRTSDLRVVATGSPPIYDVEVDRTPRVFETTTVLASLQIPMAEGYYARVGVGGGRHAFASYQVTTTVESAEISHEWGPAVGITVGREVRFSSLSLGVEVGAAHRAEAQALTLARGGS